MDEDKLRKAIAKGHQADNILSDPLVKETLAAMEADLLAGFRLAAQEDAPRYWALLKAYDEFIRRLELYVTNGRDAMREVERLNMQERNARQH